LYAPEKVFKNGSVPRRLRDGLLAAGAGGAAGAATGSAAGASSATAVGSASGAAGALPAGAATGAGAGVTSAGAGSVAATASRMKSGSPGASALADGGTTPVRAPSGGGSAGPLGGDSAGSRSTSSLGGSGGAGPGSGSTAQDPDGLTRIGGRDELDTGQRYEPVVQHDSGSLARVSTPKNTNWLADRGGIDRLNQATDEPLYFRGESDGELYDLQGTATTATVHNTETSNIASGASRAEDSVRNL